MLLVGAVEEKKRATLGVYKPIAELKDAETLRKAYELAVTQRCVPKPVVDVVRIETRPPDYPAGHIIAVNVYASPAAPIGVRWDDDGTEVYAFPLRTTTHTHFMPPTELAMLMVPKIRRAALILDSIPLDERTNVRFLFRLPNVKFDLDATFVEIDRNLTTVTMKAPPGKLVTRSSPAGLRAFLICYQPSESFVLKTPIAAVRESSRGHLKDMASLEASRAVHSSLRKIVRRLTKAGSSEILPDASPCHSEAQNSRPTRVFLPVGQKFRGWPITLTRNEHHPEGDRRDGGIHT